MEIKNKKENKLLGRKEVELFVENEGATLSRKEIKQKAAKLLKVEEANVVVENIDTHYGGGNIAVLVYVYEDEKALKGLTSEHILKRNTFEEPAEEGAEE